MNPTSDVVPSAADHIIQRIVWAVPPRLIEGISDEALEAIGLALAGNQAVHIVDFRASSKIFGKRYYFRFLMGEERRNLRRLLQERQISFVNTLVLLCVIGWTFITAICVVMFITVYLLKSWAGIDLFDGPSWLHFLFFD